MIKCIKKFIRLIKRMIIKVNKMKNEYIEESKEKIVEQKKSEQEQVVLELDNNENNEENSNLELRINEADNKLERNKEKLSTNCDNENKIDNGQEKNKIEYIDEYTNMIKSLISFQNKVYCINKEKEYINSSLDLIKNLANCEKIDENIFKICIKSVVQDIIKIDNSYKELQLQGLLELLDSIDLITKNIEEGILETDQICDRLNGHKILLKQKIKNFSIVEENPKIGDSFNPEIMEVDIGVNYDFENKNYKVIEVISPCFRYKDILLRKSFVKIKESNHGYKHSK